MSFSHSKWKGIYCLLFVHFLKANSMGFAILLSVSVLSAEFMQLLNRWNFFYEIHSILISYFSLRWPGVITGQFIWNLWLENFHWYKFSCEYISFPLPLSHHQFFMFTFRSSTFDALWSYLLAALLNKPLQILFWYHIYLCCLQQLY